MAPTSLRRFRSEVCVGNEVQFRCGGGGGLVGALRERVANVGEWIAGTVEPDVEEPGVGVLVCSPRCEDIFDHLFGKDE